MVQHVFEQERAALEAKRAPRAALAWLLQVQVAHFAVLLSGHMRLAQRVKDEGDALEDEDGYDNDEQLNGLDERSWYSRRIKPHLLYRRSCRFSCSRYCVF